MKTRSYLVVMAAVIIVPMAIFSGIGFKDLLERERQIRLQALDETARATALAIDQEIARAEGALGVLANSVHIPADDFANLYQLMEKSSRSADSWTALYDYRGDIIINTAAPFGTKFRPVGYTWARDVIDSQKITVSNVRIGAVSKMPVVSVNVPVATATGKKYMLCQVYRADHFNKLLNAPIILPTWLITVFGSDGINIARNKNFSESVAKPVPSKIYQASLRQPQGRMRYMTTEKVEVYSAFTHTSRSGWTVAVGVPVTEIDGAAQRAVWVTISAVAGIFALVLFFIFLLARRFTHSMEAVVESAQVLGRGKIPEVAPSKVDELDLLQIALRTAGIALSKENSTRLQLQIEREELLGREQQARQQAEHQNRAKDEFLAMLAHELRNPLAPISTAAQLLKVAGSNGKIVRQSSEIIERQVTHMTELINDLLDVSRVTRGLVELDKENLDMREVLEHAVEQTRTLIESRQHQLNVSMPSASVQVYGDRTRLVQVISNLLNNAAKYTQQEGQITLTLEVQAEQVMVTVRDNGSGMEPDLLPTVFDVFTQGVRTSDRSQGGLGLGLTVVKKIIDLHGGRVAAFSEGPGKGSTFGLTLPAAQAVQNGKPGKAGRDNAAPMMSASAVRPMNLMIVDDNRDAGEMLAAFFSQQGHQVALEVDPYSALAAATANPPSVFILDIGLPGMDGYELVRRFRGNAATANAVFIALTGYGQEHDKILSKAAGFDHHCVKPVSLAQLQGILAEVQRPSSS